MIDYIEERLTALKDEFELTMQARLPDTTSVMRMVPEKNADFQKVVSLPEMLKITCILERQEMSHNPSLSYISNNKILESTTLLQAQAHNVPTGISTAMPPCKAVSLKPQTDSIFGLNELTRETIQVECISSYEKEFLTPLKTQYVQKIELDKGQVCPKTGDGREGVQVVPYGGFLGTDSLQQIYFHLVQKDGRTCIELTDSKAWQSLIAEQLLERDNIQKGYLLDFDLNMLPQSLGADIRTGKLQLTLRCTETDEKTIYASTEFEPIEGKPNEITIVYQQKA